jgi:hypothetical protein
MGWIVKTFKSQCCYMTAIQTYPGTFVYDFEPSWQRISEFRRWVIGVSLTYAAFSLFTVLSVINEYGFGTFKVIRFHLPGPYQCFGAHDRLLKYVTDNADRLMVKAYGNTVAGMVQDDLTTPLNNLK